MMRKGGGRNPGWMRGILFLLFLLLFLCGAAGAEEWHFDEKGFLTGENPGDEYVLEDEENGVWQYASADLSVRIQRYQETVTYKKKKYLREYCVAEIYASPAQPLGIIQTEALKKHPAGYKLASPELLMEKSPSVFAMSDDLYGLRLKQYDYEGIVIRNGEILGRKTRDSASKQYRRSWPNMDTLAVYEDGSMKTFACDALTPEEYLAQGAVHVFSFGPVLVSEGEIGPNVMNALDAGYNEPRAAIGMAEPWHYIAIVVKGRPRDQYAGVHLDWLAEKMKELGCVEALNLDGGLTATMAFRGKLIETGGEKLRSQGSMIVFGAGRGQAAAAAEKTEDGSRTAKTTRAKVNIRKEADKSSSRVVQLGKKGTRVTVLEEAYDGDGTLWYLIRTEKGKEGYVRGDMLSLGE